ncbi:hypothetical protein D8B26_007099 [Coccidioides posadasii str. Silveira]|uniref:uncharacterized protein n=1 Tax=Coccidioides posadasii (strain RMSCC 757 / Silveira) TaxID=443226 RepID=UPI001BEDCF65|nr:hypothetical protein D8B26_007099 [Coccidioides posadasii str. Silveira]
MIPEIQNNGSSAITILLLLSLSSLGGSLSLPPSFAKVVSAPSPKVVLPSLSRRVIWIKCHPHFSTINLKDDLVEVFNVPARMVYMRLLVGHLAESTHNMAQKVTHSVLFIDLTAMLQPAPLCAGTFNAGLR